MQEIKYIGKTAGDTIISDIEARKIREQYDQVSYMNISDVLGEEAVDSVIIRGFKINPNWDTSLSPDFDIEDLLVEDSNSITIFGPGALSEGTNPFFPYIVQVKSTNDTGYREWATVTDKKYFPNFKGILIESKSEGQSAIMTNEVKEVDFDSWVSAKDLKFENNSHYNEQDLYVASSIATYYIASFSVLDPYEYTIQLPISKLVELTTLVQPSILTKIQSVTLEKDTPTTISLGVPSRHDIAYIYYLELAPSSSSYDPIGHISLKWRDDVVTTPCFIKVGQSYSEVQLECITSSSNQRINVYKVTPFFIQPTYQYTGYTRLLPISNSKETQIALNPGDNKIFKVSAFTSDFRELSNTTVTLTNDTQGAAQFNSQPTPFYTKVNLNKYKAKWTRTPGYIQIKEIDGMEAMLLRELMLLKGVDRINP